MIDIIYFNLGDILLYLPINWYGWIASKYIIMDATYKHIHRSIANIF